MIYRVTLQNGETIHTGYGPLADVWVNRHSGAKLERIPLNEIPRPAEEMWDGSPLLHGAVGARRVARSERMERPQLARVCGMSAAAFKPDSRIADLARLTAELERKQRECEGLREQLTWAVNNPDDPAYWLHSARVALSAGEKE